MQQYLGPKDFLQQLTKGKTVTGNFLIPSASGTVEDMTFKDIIFKDIEIHGGEFVSGRFINCTFDNVVFNKSSLTAVNFQDCYFKKCIFNKTQHDFGMDNCQIGRFMVTTFFDFPDVKVGFGEEE